MENLLASELCRLLNCKGIDMSSVQAIQGMLKHLN